MAILWVKKVGWMLFIIWVVSLIAFILSKSTAYNQADYILENRYGMTETDQFSETYSAIYNKYHLDLPYFYFSILPSYYPLKFTENWSLEERQLAEKLLSQKFTYTSISNYIQTLNEIEKICNKTDDCPDAMTFLKVQNKIENIDILIHQIEQENESFGNRLKRSIDQMKISKTVFTIPVIRWHGLENQYNYWMSSFIKGNLGKSIIDNKPILNKIVSALKWTLSLSLISLIVALILGGLIALATEYFQLNKTKNIIDGILYAIYSIPAFWIATLLIVFFTTPDFGKWTDLFPGPVMLVNNDSGLFKSIMNYSTMLIMPISCLVLHSLSVIYRLLQQSLMKERSSYYAFYLRSLGISKRRLYIKHLIPNSLLPIITLISNNLTSIIGGSLVIEVIFNIPGVGRLMFESILSADWNTVYALIVFISVFTVILLTLTDLIYKKLDPRITI